MSTSLKPICGNILLVLFFKLNIDPSIRPIPFVFPSSYPILAKSCIPRQIPKIFPFFDKIFSLIESINVSLFNLLIASLKDPTPGSIRKSLFLIILGLSEKEQSVLNNLVKIIENEIEERIDNHSQQVLVSNIELILSYSSRFYERQFNTRFAQNTDIVSKVDTLLKDYYKTHNLIETGQPSIDYLASECHLSANYLSDLLSKETGRSAKDHINDFLIEKAKNLLISSTDSVSGIAYSLGFNYPHYFGRIFKKKTGKTPQEYRQLN